MTFEEEMEIALLEMDSHPEFIGKNLIEETNAKGPVVVHQNSHPRLSGWYRKRLYRKKLIRRFLSANPALNISEMPGASMKRASVSCDFKGGPFNPRHDYSINLHEKLYIATGGEIRASKKRIVHHGGWKLFGISANTIPDAKKYTNSRIRSKAIRMDDIIPSYPSYYRKKYSRLIDNTI